MVDLAGLWQREMDRQILGEDFVKVKTFWEGKAVHADGSSELYPASSREDALAWVLAARVVFPHHKIWLIAPDGQRVDMTADSRQLFWLGLGELMTLLGLFDSPAMVEWEEDSSSSYEKVTQRLRARLERLLPQSCPNVLLIDGWAFPVAARSVAASPEFQKEEDLHFGAREALELVRDYYQRQPGLQVRFKSWQSWLSYAHWHVAYHYQVDPKALLRVWAEHYLPGLLLSGELTLDLFEREVEQLEDDIWKMEEGPDF